jgi:hypothetical protein
MTTLVTSTLAALAGNSSLAGGDNQHLGRRVGSVLTMLVGASDRHSTIAAQARIADRGGRDSGAWSRINVRMPADRRPSHLRPGPEVSIWEPSPFTRVRLPELEGLSICQHAASFACGISNDKRPWGRLLRLHRGTALIP